MLGKLSLVLALVALVSCSCSTDGISISVAYGTNHDTINVDYNIMSACWAAHTGPNNITYIASDPEDNYPDVNLTRSLYSSEQDFPTGSASIDVSIFESYYSYENKRQVCIAIGTDLGGCSRTMALGIPLDSNNVDDGDELLYGIAFMFILLVLCTITAVPCFVVCVASLIVSLVVGIVYVMTRGIGSNVDEARRPVLGQGAYGQIQRM
ncbi:Prokaryotic membrane lipoprotein lipid attachment site [Carpediemonas membranifera]|uniref:Prokaryotic membrane lipoprotein lipid attachment site n=1 Tax=Carpediemonas membranifera TaxID=201153 RepID=A0A8J6B857_9EUKA|nr:Prokaryotic membrane lipoprotein lipid attachment site [Carpediemonas membranifera]|eukprot:KAG9397608.1 Prokaryotic membrane lipoprotein lipid attachment site [Carpediemonas membranifera]